MLQHKSFLAFSHLVRCTSRQLVSSHGSGLFLHFTYATTRFPKNQCQVHDSHWYHNGDPGRILLVSRSSLMVVVSDTSARFLFPDSPTSAWFLTPDERSKAIQRIKVGPRSNASHTLTPSRKIKRVWRTNTLRWNSGYSTIEISRDSIR